MKKPSDVRERALRITQGFIYYVKQELDIQKKTMTWLVDKTGVGRANISCHMSGRTPITITTMAKYEEALGIQWFIGAYSPGRARTQARALREHPQ